MAQMKRSFEVGVAVVAGCVLSVAPRVLAQRVHRLSGESLTSDNLVHVLTPKGPRPRGIGLQPPQCKHFKQQAARGIELAPKADIAALSVEFNTDSAELTPAAQKTLDTLGQALDSAELKPCCFEIEGYTDSSGSKTLNERLSEARAESVVNYLAQHAGIDHSRMMPKGFGASAPLASNATETGRAENRRVQILNLGYGTPSDY
jgi:outer membrane protein OmpA-like peptidoglycan-associated protein